MTPEEQILLAQKIAQSFSPSAPINTQSLFAGRFQQFMDVTTAVSQRGQHVVLFGERGVGKTSLSTIVAQLYGPSMAVGKLNCDPTTTFSDLWRKLFREITVTTPVQGIGFTSQTDIRTGTLADYLPVVVTPDDIRHILQRFGNLLLIIDELDRIESKETTALLADAIKSLSDHSVPTTLMLVGVADNVTTLIHEHQSIERALVQIRMPRMTIAELNEIMDKGIQNVGMTISNSAKAKIASLSQGLPHYTHLLALHALQAAVTRRSMLVNDDDVTTAISKSLNKAQHSIIGAYHKATNSPRENLYPQVLLACALARPDSLGYFSAADIREPMSRIMGKKMDIPAFSQHLNAFCSPARGPVLQRTGELRRLRYRFVNPLMQPFVIMDGLRSGLIDDTSLLSDDVANPQVS